MEANFQCKSCPYIMLGGFSYYLEGFILAHLRERAPALGEMMVLIKATTGVCETQLHQAYKPCAIGALLLQTHGNVWWWSAYVCTRGQLRSSPCIPIGLWWHCWNGTWFTNLVKTSSQTPRGDVKAKVLANFKVFNWPSSFTIRLQRNYTSHKCLRSLGLFYMQYTINIKVRCIFN